MSVFSPLRPGDSVASSVVWLDVGPDPVTFGLPVPKNQLGALGDGCVMRMASSTAGADVIFLIGDDSVVVTADSGILFPAGSLETMGLKGSTHIAVMAPSVQEGSTILLNITIGLGA